MKLTLNSGTTRSIRALTFVEVLVAVAIIGLALAAVLTATSTGLASIKQAREDLRATQIMSQRLEVIRLFKWSQITNQSYLNTAAFQEAYDPNSTNTGTMYTGQYSLSNCPYSLAYEGSLKMITVTLTWTNGLVLSNKVRLPYVHTRTMNTLVCSNGLQNYIF